MNILDEKFFLRETCGYKISVLTWNYIGWFVLVLWNVREVVMYFTYTEAVLKNIRILMR